jgi:anthranilate phosphoribosyltransferase
MKATALFEHLIAKKNLNHQQMQEVLHACIAGQFNDLQIATFLALMRAKGETREELAAAAQILHSLAHPIALGSNLIDIVGTGGDLKNTFNISTTASFVVAACKIPVAKHGSRSISSRSGSADVLEHAGFKLQLTDKQLQTCIKECNLAFLFAPHFHPALKQVRQAREQLGIRTFFNLLGPLINPAFVKRQVVGVFSVQWLEPLAHVLSQLGSQRSLVLSSEDGLDEISIAAPTQVLEYNRGQLNQWVIRPEAYGLKHNSLDSLLVDSPAQSLQVMQSVLKGKAGAAYDIVLMNCAAAVYCAHDHLTFDSALEQVKRVMDDGQAYECFDKLRLLTQSFNPHE